MTSKGTPNPALHLTPPADSGRIAHPVMAVQVSLLFGGRSRGREWSISHSPCGRVDPHASAPVGIRCFLAVRLAGHGQRLEGCHLRGSVRHCPQREARRCRRISPPR
ncbi:hypothetical protein C1280_15005 [Gemmata obscuriglobus]|uniref:Uncharacterized protein n=1 Tax=Gemmata obscuriglobus TaxID=114 RepID=A0A2Z3H373_9BACT|nr:hypothetical protein C1280_15005 [Gemmata obscuriglobus]